MTEATREICWNIRHAWLMYALLVPALHREIVETRMKTAGVPTAVHYPLALHMQPVFKHLGHKEGDFPLSESAARCVLSLPMHPYLTDEQQVQVVEALAQAVA
jgi:UDP-2-acetamido-2-deoxy-ribo-hexuluronate aminotransferase